MVLTVIIAVIFLFNFWRGWRRGFFLELLSIFSTVIAFVLGGLFYQKLSFALVAKLHLGVPNTAANYLLNDAVMSKAGQPFFAAFFFILIFFAVKIVIRLLIMLFGSLRNLFPSGKIGRFFGAVLALIVAYLSVQLLLTMISIFPASASQQLLANSSLASWMIIHTPISSSLLLKLFVENIIHIPALFIN